jgi:hypothetical protein
MSKAYRTGDEFFSRDVALNLPYHTKSQLLLFFLIRHPEPVEGSAPQRRGS